MSNEELVLLIQQGGKEHTAQLWFQVERFIFMKAGQYERHLSGCAADAEDLRQSGYFAMMEAVKYYRPEKGYKFITYLDLTLRKAFRQVAGIRSSRRDATHSAVSLDAPISSNEDAGPLSDLVTDDAAQAPFIQAEQRDFITYVRQLISYSMERLSDREQQLLRLVYLRGQTLTEAAELAGYSSAKTASNACYNVLVKLRHSSTARELKSALVELGEYAIIAEAAKNTSLGSFRRTRTSAPEGTAIMHTCYEEKSFGNMSIQRLKNIKQRLFTYQ
ncbi:MAG: sigma-70 family RNA polymerase sigma factor [Desulfosporosinus sp.]